MTDHPDQDQGGSTKRLPSDPAEPNAEQRHPLARHDDRWRIRRLRRDWLILAVMIAIYLLWTGIVFFFEPGIR